MRVFKRGYYELLEEINADSEEYSPVISVLRRRLGWREQVTQKASKVPAESISIDYQLRLFREQYPKGFQGAKWAKEKRGIDTTRRLKRHRDVAIVEARQLLARARLMKLLEQEQYGEIIEAMLEVGDTTDLIAKSKLKVLQNLSEESTKRLSEQLFDFLHGEEQLGIRFERFVDTLARTTKKRPTWQLATVFLALAMPKEHVCVKASAMRSQASGLGRRFTLSSMPNAPKYEHMLKMALTVKEKLEDAELRPRDLLDVYDFMETTLSRKALKKIESMKHGGHTSKQAEKAA